MARQLIRDAAISAGTRRTTLSRREKQIAEVAIQGLTVSEMAGRLEISPNTVKTHLSHIYARLGVRNRAELSRSLGFHQKSPVRVIVKAPRAS